MLKYITLFLCLLITPWVCIAEDSDDGSSTTGSDTQPVATDQTTETTSNTAMDPSTKNIKYVDDNLLIMMRAGNSSKHKIVRHLSSGTALEVLEISEDYSKVRTNKGTEGWVLNQYLSDQPIAKERLAITTKQNVKLETQNNQLKKELNTLSRQHEKLLDKSKTLGSQLQKFRSVAAKPIKLSEENAALTKTKIDLESENEIMRQEIQILRDQSDKQWFISGAGVLFFGIILGLIIPKMRKRRQSDWSSL